MAKDAKGHGSNRRDGGSSPMPYEIAPRDRTPKDEKRGHEISARVFERMGATGAAKKAKAGAREAATRMRSERSTKVRSTTKNKKY